MNISLGSFENEIDEKILERGWQYYKKGRVADFIELSPGEYEFRIEGSEEYTVAFNIQKNNLADPTCTCPYDGPVCKHVAAAIFYYTNKVAQNDTLPEELLYKTRMQKKKAAKKKTIEQQVEEIVAQLPVEELQFFIKAQSKMNDEFAHAFLAKYAYLNQDVSKETFVKQLQKQLRSLTNRHGFIDYYQARQVRSVGSRFMEVAESHLQQGRFLLTWNMACAALEVFTEVLEYSDDSNGDVSSCIEEALELMFEVTKQQLPEEIRKACFGFCTNAYRKRTFVGWDWNSSCIDMATRLVSSEAEVSELHSLIDMVKPSGETWDYDMEVAEVQRYNLIAKAENAEKANEFLQQNLHNSSLRKQYINQLIEDGRYDEAIRIAEKGIKKDEKNFPGTADDWREYLLKIYLLKKDSGNIIKYAFHLFAYSNHAREDLYSLIKEHTPAEDWADMVQKIIRAIHEHERFGSYYRIAQIYLREQYWDKLFQLIKQNPSLDLLDEYEKHLPVNFNEEINELYMAGVNNILKNTGRKYYETACRYFRKLKKRGAAELVVNKIEYLRSKYPQRRALMELLDTV